MEEYGVNTWTWYFRVKRRVYASGGSQAIRMLRPNTVKWERAKTATSSPSRALFL